MDKTTNSLNWFEIPVTDIKRAKKFYETLFSIEMEENEMMGMKMAFFPMDMGSGKASGALVQGENYNPSMDGTIIYLNANPDMQPILDKIENAGGNIVMSKTEIGEDIGYMAFFADTEGNRVALHSMG